MYGTLELIYIPLLIASMETKTKQRNTPELLKLFFLYFVFFQVALFTTRDINALEELTWVSTLQFGFIYTSNYLARLLSIKWKSLSQNTSPVGERIHLIYKLCISCSYKSYLTIASNALQVYNS